MWTSFRSARAICRTSICCKRARQAEQSPSCSKRGLASTLKELLMSAEYIMAGGNEQVILCERGIRTYDDYTRNTLDLAAVPMLKELTHLPVIVDPSHATGIARLVRPDGAGCCRLRQRRPHHRGAQRPHSCAVRRRAIPAPRAVRCTSPRLDSAACREAVSRNDRRHRRPRPDRRLARQGIPRGGRCVCSPTTSTAMSCRSPSSAARWTRR